MDPTLMQLRPGRRTVIAGGLFTALVPGAARAQGTALAFDAQWQALTFRRIPATEFTLAGDTLRVRAERSSSVIYRSVPEGLRGATGAAWRWSVAQSVPATDLGMQGGDDRNLSVYFVFMDAASASRVGPGTSLNRLLRNRAARSLLYVWGGQRARGAAVPSPYFRGRGTSVILRPAGTGSFAEEVDLHADHARLFGARPEALVGVAVSSDSDDTGGLVRAEIADLRLT